MSTSSAFIDKSTAHICLSKKIIYEQCFVTVFIILFFTISFKTKIFY